jgi:hypothetical protein
VVSVIVWALAHHQGNYAHASTGKTGVLVAAGGALLIGGANAIITFSRTSALGSADMALAQVDPCVGPLDPLCRAAGQVVGSASASATDLVLGALGGAFVEAAQGVSETALDALDATTRVDLTATWLTRNLGVIAAVTLPAVVALFTLQVIAAVLRREPGGLGRAVMGVGKATLGSALRSPSRRWRCSRRPDPAK